MTNEKPILTWRDCYFLKPGNRLVSISDSFLIGLIDHLAEKLGAADPYYQALRDTIQLRDEVVKVQMTPRGGPRCTCALVTSGPCKGDITFRGCPVHDLPIRDNPFRNDFDTM